MGLHGDLDSESLPMKGGGLRAHQVHARWMPKEN